MGIRGIRIVLQVTIKKSERTEMDFSIQFNFPTNLTNILTIYKHTLNSYVLNALITWRRAITDDATIRKLLNLIISRMSNILFHISKVVQESSISRKSPPLDVPTNIIRDNFLLDPLNLLHLYSWGKKMKIYGELSRLMDSSWKISSSLYPNSLFNVLAHSEEGRTRRKITGDMLLPILIKTHNKAKNFLVYKLLEKMLNG